MLLRTPPIYAQWMGDVLYAEAELYDVAFSYRDYAAETEAIEAWYRRTSGRARAGAAIELAAGPGRHAIELARRGSEASALDLSPAMCALAERRANEAGVAINTACANMIDFELGRRFDLALLLINSVAHIHAFEDLVRHLKSVARHLTPNGVYVMEAQHPKDFAGRGAKPTAVSTPWTMRRGELEVTVKWGDASDPYDAVAQIFEAHVELVARERGREQRLSEAIRMRDWTKNELEAAVAFAGDLELAEFHGDFAPDAVFDHSDASWRMIAVIKKRG